MHNKILITSCFKNVCRNIITRKINKKSKDDNSDKKTPLSLTWNQISLKWNYCTLDRWLNQGNWLHLRNWHLKYWIFVVWQWSIIKQSTFCYIKYVFDTDNASRKIQLCEIQYRFFCDNFSFFSFSISKISPYFHNILLLNSAFGIKY